VTAFLAGILMIAGSILLILLTPGKGPVWAGVGCALVGFGLGFANTTYLVALQSSVGWSERGVATSSNLFARLMGQSLGAAVFGAILNFCVYRQVPGSRDTV
jgi:predicted MFS family arabinose efflux permease